MAKMNLSIALDLAQKGLSELKATTGEFGHFTSRVRQAQAALQNNTAAQANITALTKLQQQHLLARDSVRAAEERLDKLNQRMKEAKNPSATLTAQYNKQKARVQDLRDKQADLKSEMSKTGKELKQAGINTKSLATEEARLSQEHTKTLANLNRLTSRYEGLEKIKSRVGKIVNFDNIKKAGLAVGGTLAGWGYAVTSTATEMEKTKIAADNLRMSVKDLQVMQMQASDSGFSGEIDGVMRRFTKRFGQLQATGGGALGGYLKGTKNQLFAQLKGAKDNEEAYQMVLKAFGSLKNDQQKMMFADAAFGQDGRKMMDMLESGIDGYNDAQQKFASLGGSFNDEDFQAAVDYKQAMSDIALAFKSIKQQALAPVIKKLTELSNNFLDKFKNADWREGAIEQLRLAADQLFKVLEFLGKSIVFIYNNLPEVILGIAALKIGMYALNAAIAANPIGLIVAGIAALAAVIAYAYVKFEPFRNLINAFGSALKVVGVAVWEFAESASEALTSLGKIILDVILFPMRTMLKLLDKIPKRFMPQGVSEFLDTTKEFVGIGDAPEQKLATVSQQAVEREQQARQNLEQAQQIPGQTEQPILTSGQNTQSKTQVDLRIESDKPVRIEGVNTDKKSDVSVDTGNLLGFAY